MSEFSRRTLTLAAALAITTVGVVSTEPAFAENTRNTNMSNWAAGKSSKNWHDKNSDSWHTAVELYGCSTNWSGVWTTLQLRRVVGGAPDGNYGNRGYGNCSNRELRGAWGDVRKSNYHFTMQNMGDSWYRFSARRVQIYW